MRNRRRILVVMASVAIVAGLAAWLMICAAAGPPEPMYEGKPLSYWLEYPYTQGIPIDSIQKNTQEAQIAIRQMGTNAIPFLLRRLRAHDSPVKVKVLTWATKKRWFGIQYADPQSLTWRGRFGFQTLGTNAASAVPELIKILDENISDSSSVATLSSLEAIGPEAKAAGPAVVQMMSNPSADVRLAAYTALRRIPTDPEVAVPVLIQRLAEPWAPARGWVVNDLGDFGGKAKAAIPALVALYNDTNANSDYGSIQHTAIVFGVPNVQNYAQNVIKKIDLETYNNMFPNRVRRK